MENGDVGVPSAFARHHVVGRQVNQGLWQPRHLEPPWRVEALVWQPEVHQQHHHTAHLKGTVETFLLSAVRAAWGTYQKLEMQSRGPPP